MTNQLTHLASTALTMSSREIAELTGKEHRNFLADIDKMLSVLGEDVLKFQQMFVDSYGRHQRGFCLPKNLTLNLITGYRADIRLKVIDRWLEMEASPKTPAIPQTYAEALRLAADQAAQIEEQQARITENTRTIAVLNPKARVFDTVIGVQERRPAPVTHSYRLKP